ncbi:MAG: DMT family transporter [Pseudomonadota bacterium]
MTSRQTSVSFVAAAAITLTAIMLYDVMGAIVKHLSQDYPAPQLAMFRNLFALVPTVLVLIWSQTWRQAGRPIVIRRWKLALARGGIGTLAQVSFYLALARLEFATATAIVFAGPLFVTALSIPVLGHRVGPWRWASVLIGFAGVMLVMQPTAEGFSWVAVLPLCAALGYATNSVTAKLFDETVPTALINLYQVSACLVGAALLVLFSGDFVPIENLQDWLWLIGMGLAGGLAVYCLVSAYRLADPSSLSPFEYFAIPFSFCLGWIFFGETPFDRLIPGVFLIVGGGLAITWREHRLAKRRHVSLTEGDMR